MSPFEALYGRIYNTPIIWSDLVKWMLLGPDMLNEMEQEMQVSKKNLKVAKDKHKIYADQQKVIKEFKVGEHVYLCIKPKKELLEDWFMCQISTSILWAFQDP